MPIKRFNGPKPTDPTPGVGAKWLGLCYIDNMIRKERLVNGEEYHIFSKSIAGYQIFNNEDEFTRMQQLMRYYQIENELKFSNFTELKIVQHIGFNNFLNLISKDKVKLVQIIAYCLMPTHIHLILKQLQDNGISNYMRKILNSYSCYFNSKHKRNGPLWESKFKSVLVVTDEQLLHLTRYLHLNPVTACLIDNPKNWPFSSYKEYLYQVNDASLICQFNDVLEIEAKSYSKFVNNQISYQRELAKIRKLLFDRF